MFPLVLDFQFFIDFKTFWKGFKRFWKGFGEGLGLIFGSKVIFGGQNETVMFKKCLATFVGSFELMFLDVWG